MILNKYLAIFLIAFFILAMVLSVALVISAIRYRKQLRTRIKEKQVKENKARLKNLDKQAVETATEILALQIELRELKQKLKLN